MCSKRCPGLTKTTKLSQLYYFVTSVGHFDLDGESQTAARYFAVQKMEALRLEAQVEMFEDSFSSMRKTILHNIFDESVDGITKRFATMQNVQ